MRLCSVAGCENKHRATGLCSSHYNAANGFRNTRYRITCAWCGAEHMSARKTGYACCAEHRAWFDVYSERGPGASNVPLRHPSRVAQYVNPLRKRWPASRVFFTECAVCSKLFATPYTVSTCGAACADVKRQDDRRESKQRRRARQRDAFVAPVSRREIYERDGYACMLCGDPLVMSEQAPHPLAPTIDHVLALANGGTHEPANVQAAHFMCNSIKGSRH